MDRMEAHRGAMAAKEKVKGAEAAAREAREEYFRCAQNAHNILFGDAIDHPTMKLAVQQIFGNTDNPDHLKCAEAVIALAGLEQFDKAAAIQLTAALKSRDKERARVILEGCGIPFAMTSYLIGPLELILV